MCLEKELANVFMISTMIKLTSDVTFKTLNQRWKNIENANWIDVSPQRVEITLSNSSTIIDHNEKDAGMYVLPKSIASIKGKRLKHNEEINLVPYACSKKTSICFFKRFPTAVQFDKIHIRYLFRYGQFNVESMLKQCWYHMSYN